MRTLTVILMLLFAIPAVADTYKWEDDKGTLNFTEDLGKIPKKYRKKAQKIGDVEAVTPMVTDGKGKAAGQPGSKPASVEGAQDGTRQDQMQEKPSSKAIYGNKTGDAWKSDFAQLKGDLKAAESELAKNRERLNNPNGMSRDDIIVLQNNIRNNEINVIKSRKLQDDLKQDALKAGVPPDLMD